MHRARDWQGCWTTTASASCSSTAAGWRESYVRWLVEQTYRKLGVSGQVALVRQVLAADALPRR